MELPKRAHWDAQNESLPPPTAEGELSSASGLAERSPRRLPKLGAVARRAANALRVRLMSAPSATVDRPESPIDNGAAATPPVGPWGLPEPPAIESDPFADKRDALNALLATRPPHLQARLERQGLPEDTWYNGPMGITLLDALSATDEEFAQYEELAKMRRWDEQRIAESREQHAKKPDFGADPAGS